MIIHPRVDSVKIETHIRVSSFSVTLIRLRVQDRHVNGIDLLHFKSLMARTRLLTESLAAQN